MQKRPRRLHGGGQAQFGHHPVFFVQPQGKVEQPGVVLAHQPRQGQGGAHVGQSIVCGVVRNAVGPGQVLQFEAGRTVVFLGPVDALGAQRVGHAHHVKQVPTATLVLPLTRVGVDEVAPEHVARDLIVETDGVVAHANGAGAAQFGLDAGGKFALGHAAFQAHLRCDAGDEAGLGVG